MNFISNVVRGSVPLLLVLALGACGKSADNKANVRLEGDQAVKVSKDFPSAIGNGGQFGSRVAMSGNLAVVGAPNDVNPMGTTTGAAYIYERQANNTWLLKQKLFPISSLVDGKSGQMFGAAVAISGERVFVGAPLSVDPAVGQPRGSVHVFEKQSQEGPLWVEDVRWGIPNLLTTGQWTVGGGSAGTQWRQFGPMTIGSGASWTVSTVGTNDVDLFTRKGAAPDQTNKDCAPWTGSSNESCVLSGAGDHYIGVRGYAGQSKFTVQASLPSQSLALQQQITYGPFTVQPGQRLRAQLTGTGDPDLYLHNAATRAASTDICASDSSATTESCVRQTSAAYYVSVYGYQASTFQLQVIFEPGHDDITSGGGYALIGSGLSATGDLVAVTGPNQLNVSTGKVNVLRKNARGHWKIESTIGDPENTSNTGQFGTSVAMTSNRLVIGASGGGGRVLTYSYAAGTWVNDTRAELVAGVMQQVPWILRDKAGAEVGNAVAVAVDADRFALGVPSANAGKGIVRVFDWDGDRWTERQKMVPQGTSTAGFGTSVALYSGKVAVGAPYNDGVGAAYLFANVGSKEPAVYQPTAATSGSNFGNDVALGATMLLGGAPYHGASLQGAIFGIVPFSDVCGAPLSDGMPCDDGNACTTGEKCQAGVCKSPTGTVTCNDGAECTADSCHPQLGCVYDTRVPEQQGWSCSIASCGSGVCQAGTCNTATNTNPMCQLTPEVSCVYPSGSGFRAVFGYRNTTTPGTNLSIAVGSNDTATNKINKLSSGYSSSDQPTWLQWGYKPNAFTVPLAANASVTWSLGNKTATATGAATCSLVSVRDGTALRLNGVDYLIEPKPDQIVAASIKPTTGAVDPLSSKGDVNPDGSYSHSIPLWVPPGTHGLQPNLSLEYNSRGGNGLVGVGWSLSGFSQITRCPKTKRVAGVVAPVNYKDPAATGSPDEEQFCLDGNPLVKWGDGSYRTRIETFNKITRSGSGTSLAWTVKTKDGRELAFSHGGVTRQRKDGAGNLMPAVVPGWWLTSITDPFNNRIQFDYSNSNGPDSAESAWTLERYPTSIKYNYPNYQREILLKYVDRPAHDVLESYVGGIRYVTTKLLSAVEMRVKNEANSFTSVKEYRLAYHANATNGTNDWSDTSGRKSISGRSLLQSVKECDSSNPVAICGPPTTFDWETGSWAFERTVLNSSVAMDQKLLSITDVDKDGKPDLVTGQVVTKDLCAEAVNGSPPLSSEGLAAFYSGCRVPRPSGYWVGQWYGDSRLPDYGFVSEDDTWHVCDTRKIWGCSTTAPGEPYLEYDPDSQSSPPGVIQIPTNPTMPSGTQLCDGYPRKLYDPQVGGCMILRSDAKFARYKYFRNTSVLRNGAISSSFGTQADVVNKYIVTSATKPDQLPAPLFFDYDNDGTNNVVLQEQDNFDKVQLVQGDYQGGIRLTTEVWALGGNLPIATQTSNEFFLDGGWDMKTFQGTVKALAIADLDSDGKLEIISGAQGPVAADGRYPTYWTRWGFNQPTIHMRKVAWQNKQLEFHQLTNAEEATAMDLDGDGQPEFITTFGDGNFGSETTFPFAKALNRSPTFVDINGDGLVDALDRGISPSTIGQTVIINTGLRGTSAGDPGSPSRYLNPTAKNTDDGVRVGDFDRDGQSDVLLTGAGWNGTVGSSAPVLLLRKGKTFRTVKLDAPAGGLAGITKLNPDTKISNEGLPASERGITGWREIYVLDFDGDGSEDIVQREGAQLVLYRRKGGQPDLMKVINRGLTTINPTEVKYTAITDVDSSGYNPANCATTDLKCNTKEQDRVTSGMWVVKNLTTDAGDDLQTKRVKVYSYADGRTDKVSGAFLGFRQFTTNEFATQTTRTVENYLGSANDLTTEPRPIAGFGFVFAGKPKRETISIRSADGAGFNTTTTDYEYEFVTFSGGSMGLSGMTRPKKITTSIDDFRQTCVGAEKTSTATFNYVTSGAGLLTGELASETVVDKPGAGCAAGVDRTHAERTTTKTMTYHPEDTNKWWVGRVKTATTAITVGSNTVTTSTETVLDSTYGVVKKAITMPSGSADERSETEYTFDSSGMPLTITSRTAGVADRILTTTYDTYGFPRTVTNQLGHRTESVTDPFSGQVVWSRDMNGVITRKVRDGFFREIETQVPTRGDRVLATVTSYTAEASSLTPRRLTVESQLKDTAGTALRSLGYQYTLIDRFGRPSVAYKRNWAGNYVGTEKKYDWLGRLISESVPAVSVGSQGYTRYEYDELDRVTKVYSPECPTPVNATCPRTTTDRVDLKTITTNPDGKVSHSVADTLGRVVETRAMEGTTARGKMTFTYRADDKLLTSRDSVGNVTTMTYDALGRRMKLVDPDAGTTETYYNGLGEVRLEQKMDVSTTPAVAREKTTFVRDILGRTLEQRVEELEDLATSRPARTRATAYAWDTAPYGVGQLTTSASYDGVAKAFAYDSLGRPIVESQVRSSVVQKTSRTYDEAGRLDVLTYPEALTTGQAAGTGVATSVQYTYNDLAGALASVRNAANTTQIYWQAQERDELGRIKKEQFGSGAVTTRSWDAKRGWLTSITTQVGTATPLQAATYSYTPGGLMKGRADTSAPGGSLNESFQYDALNRLQYWCVKDVAGGSNQCGQAQWGVNYVFADNGNLTARKTFVGTTQSSPLENIAFTYPANGQPRPHAVTQRAWAVGSGTGGTFAYDFAGRQWSRMGQTAMSQVVTYNANDLPEKIVTSSSTTTYLYDADGTRYQKKAAFGLNLTRTTTYAGGIYELREEAGTAAGLVPKTHIYYVTAGNTVLAQLKREEPALSTLTAEYMHNDHLGTVSFTTSSAGVASTKVRTDPYGNRFDPTKAPRLDTPPPAAIGGVTRGFTGHEMEVDDLGVVNMNGRIFDPINGRFNSPDPVVQAPSFSQSYNRYMYVMGNPVGATDPTGYMATYDSNGRADQYTVIFGSQDAYHSSWQFLSSHANTGSEWDDQDYDYGDDAAPSEGGRGEMAAKWESSMLNMQSFGRLGVSASGKLGLAYKAGAGPAEGQLLQKNGSGPNKDAKGIATGDATAGGKNEPKAFSKLDHAIDYATRQAQSLTRQDAERLEAQGDNPDLAKEYGMAIYTSDSRKGFIVGPAVEGRGRSVGGWPQVNPRELVESTPEKSRIVALAHSHPTNNASSSATLNDFQTARVIRQRADVVRAAGQEQQLPGHRVLDLQRISIGYPDGTIQRYDPRTGRIY
ncbi:MAG: RHS repeat-associated core domain-containing protein [Deltaproteobacteria bacterium]|nr:RHS repeat-associated core domain-containing protein [Deltaproteobacteria bacterium]